LLPDASQCVNLGNIEELNASAPTASNMWEENPYLSIQIELCAVQSLVSISSCDWPLFLWETVLGYKT